MGGRVGCHVALVEPVQAVICFGYPLCGAGDRSKLRDQVLLELKTPTLFAQGTRDPLCPLDLLELQRRRQGFGFMSSKAADHSLLVGKATLKALGSSQDETDDEISVAIARFLNTLGDPRQGRAASL